MKKLIFAVVFIFLISCFGNVSASGWGIGTINDNVGNALSDIQTTSTEWHGMIFIPNKNTTLLGVGLASGGSPILNVTLFLLSDQSVLTSNVSSNYISSFNYPLVSGTYYILAVRNGTSSFSYGRATPVTSKISGTNLNYTNFTYTNPGWNIGNDQIQAIHNITTSYSQGSVTLTSPPDNYYSPITNVQFNCSASIVGGASLVNMSLWTNSTGIWKINQTLSKTGTLNSSQFLLTLPSPKISKWGCQACDSDGDCGFSLNRTLIIDTTYPLVNLISGNGTQNYGTLAVNHSISYNITDTNLFSCWINYNGVNMTIPCTNGAINTTSLALQLNLYNATIYVNDTAGNINSSFFTWNYLTFENNRTFDATAYETDSHTFILNLSYNASLFSPRVTLEYAGTNYSTTNVGSGNEGLFMTTLSTPIISTSSNKTFYWNIGTIYSNSTTPSSNQSLDFIKFQLCNNTYNVSALNFTFRDEQTGALINATTNATNMLVSFRYWLGDGTSYRNYSYQTLSNTTSNTYSFCLYPLDKTLKIDMDMEYSATDYAERIYAFRNYSVNNQTQNISLYVLLSSEATKFTIILKKGTDYFSEALVDVYKYFVGEGIYKKVMSGVTNDAGSFIGYLGLDQTYKFIPTKEGVIYSESIKQASCSASPCEIEIQVEEVILDPYSDFYEYFAQNIEYDLDYNLTSKLVTLTFLDTLGTAQYWRLWVYQSNYANDTLITICDEKSYSVSGTLNCNFTGYRGDIITKVYISRSPEKLVEIITFLNQTASDILGLTGILASIILIVVITLTGTRNPIVALLLLPFSLIALKFIGLLPLDWLWIGGISVFILWIISKINT